MAVQLKTGDRPSFIARNDPLLQARGIPDMATMESMLSFQTFLSCAIKMDKLPSPDEYKTLVDLLTKSPGIMALISCMAAKPAAGLDLAGLGISKDSNPNKPMTMPLYRALHAMAEATNNKTMLKNFWDLCIEKKASSDFKALYKYCYEHSQHRRTLFGRPRPISPEKYLTLVFASENKPIGDYVKGP